MSHRERPAPRGRQSGDPPGRAGTPVSWDDLFDRLPPAPRARLIAAAGDAGCVAADQVPAAEPARHLLHRLLAGDGADDVGPLDTRVAIDDLPADLDPRQRAAVALAVRTPDVALVHAPPDAGTARVAAEAVALAARRGERVLLVAADPAVVDRVLDRLADRPEVCPLRCVDKNDAAASPAAAGSTFAAHTRRLTDEARSRAQARVDAAVATCRRRDSEAAVYDHLLDLAEQHHRLQARRSGAAVNGEFTALTTEVAARRTDADRARTTVAELETVLAGLRPRAAARAAGRWWTLAWWRGGGAAARLAEAEAKHRRAESDAAAADAAVDQAALAMTRRKAELADQAVAVERELALVADKWQQAVRHLPADGPRPADLSPDAAAAAREAWAKGRDADRRELDAARGWADGLDPLLEALPGRLLEAVNLVAGTPAAVAADPHFGGTGRGPFDLLVVEDAHAVADADLLAVARRARRWVLIGQPDANGSSVSGVSDPGSRDRGQRPRLQKAAPPPRPGFTRLWQLLHADPWARDGDRLVCRLRLVSPAARGRLSREPVADRPDVELRLDGPELAEVVFPVHTPVAKAVEYLFQQLGELPAGPDPAWEETSERLVARWQCGSSSVAELGDGVRAVVTDAAIAAVEFDRAAGWDRDRASAWVHRHAGRCGPGRTVKLGPCPAATARPDR